LTKTSSSSRSEAYTHIYSGNTSECVVARRPEPTILPLLRILINGDDADEIKKNLQNDEYVCSDELRHSSRSKNSLRNDLRTVSYRKDTGVRFDYYAGKWIEHRLLVLTEEKHQNINIAIIVLDLTSECSIRDLKNSKNMLNRQKRTSKEGFSVCLLALKPIRSICTKTKNVLMQLYLRKCYCSVAKHQHKSPIHLLFMFLFQGSIRIVSKREVRNLAEQFGWRHVEIRNDPKHIRGQMRRPLHYMTSDVLFARELRDKLLKDV